MATLQRIVFGLSAFSATSFELVSQTFSGNISTHATIPGVPSPPSPKLAVQWFGLDMERLSMRSNSHIVVEMAKYNITSEVQTSMIMDVETKRMTQHQNQITTGPAPSTTSTCVFYEFPDLKEAASVRKCIADLTASTKPVGTEGDLQKFTFNFDVSITDANSTMAETVYTDASFVVKKAIADTTIHSGGTNIVTHTELVDMNAKAGAPDSSVFTIPPEWGTCEKGTMPLAPVTGALGMFLKCVGFAPSQPLMVV